VLEEGHKVNVMQLSPIAEADHNKEIVSNQRIDFLYEELNKMLTIRIKYSDVSSEAPIVSQILRFPIHARSPPVHRDSPEARVIIPPTRRVRIIPVGTEFVHENKYYRVTMSDGVATSSICLDDGVELRLTNNELWNIIVQTL
jgi:hypothetical protein